MTVGLIAPSSAPIEPDRLDKGIATLSKRGLRVRRYRDAVLPYGYLAGTDAARTSELNTALSDQETNHIFCVRGGYGALRLLADIDYEAARNHPKILIGYSDITALQLALWHRSGLRSLSGSMVAVDWVDPPEEGERLFWSMLNGPVPLVLPATDDTFHTVRPGTAEGILLGGNMTTIARLLGTPYSPDYEGCILFLEDVAEAPYRIDALFAQLRLAGILDRIAGLMLGHFSGWTPEDDRPTLTYTEVIAHYADRLDIPVISGVPYGHTRHSYALPIGVRACLDASQPSPTVIINESLTT